MDFINSLKQHNIDYSNISFKNFYKNIDSIEFNKNFLNYKNIDYIKDSDFKSIVLNKDYLIFIYNLYNNCIHNYILHTKLNETTEYLKNNNIDEFFKIPNHAWMKKYWYRGFQYVEAISCEIKINNLIKPGCILEFGVYKGRSIKILAKLFNDRNIYGFDCWKGLPISFGTHWKENTFQSDKIKKDKKNIKLIDGYFEDSLPNFIKNFNEEISFIHIDCDIYSSTLTIFKYLQEHIKKGTIISFDEIIGYDEYLYHELLAFYQFIKFKKFNYSVIGSWHGKITIIIK
jgi:hypothetical protein